MGTVHLRITDDDGDKHKFTLTHVNYMPTSPVNLLLTRVLIRQFTNENGIDFHGTGIQSCYEHHTLIWDHSKYRKTFKTTIQDYQNVSSVQDTLVSRRITLGFNHITTMELVGHSRLKQKIKSLLNQMMKTVFLLLTQIPSQT